MLFRSLNSRMSPGLLEDEVLAETLKQLLWRSSILDLISNWLFHLVARILFHHVSTVVPLIVRLLIFECITHKHRQNYYLTEYSVNAYLVWQHSDVGIFDSLIKLLSLTGRGHLFVQFSWPQLLVQLANWAWLWSSAIANSNGCEAPTGPKGCADITPFLWQAKAVQRCSIPHVTPLHCPGSPQFISLT